MADDVVPLTTYKLESLTPVKSTDAAAPLGMYLLDLMQAQGYEVVGGVWYEVPDPEVCDYPKGWAVLRALVNVREFDVDVNPDEAP